MKKISSGQIERALAQVNHSPAEMMRVMLQSISAASNSEFTAFNATSPTQTVMEAAIITSASVLQEIKAITRAHTKSTVDNWSDLYLHMNDVDFGEMTALPGSATLNLFLSVDEVRRIAVPMSDGSDLKYIEFPAHTTVTVGDTDLMFKFPIRITVGRAGGLSVKYVLSKEPILGRVRNVLINHKYVKYNDVDGVTFPIEVVQASMTSDIHTVTESSGFKTKIRLKDQFFRIKAFTWLNNRWIEIDTTRRITALNNNRTTLQYTVDGSNLTVQLPYYYASNGMIGNEIRLDIYTTKGAITQGLAQYPHTAYQSKFYDSNNPSNIFQGKLGSLSLHAFYSDDTIRGGREPLPFNEIKDRVINRSTITEGIPVTEHELINRLRDVGLSSTKTLDNVTDRKYAASRLLPPPVSGLTVTGVGCNVQSMDTTFDKLSKLKTVRASNQTLTVLPSTLYSIDNGIFDVVDSDLVDNMRDPTKTSPESLATWANGNSLVFSPYFYVHDIRNSRYSVRPYRLDKPEVIEKHSVNENPTLGVDANIYNYQMTMMPNYGGYSLYVGLAVGETFKEIPLRDISLQMSYLDATGSNRYYIEGVLESAIDSTTGRPIGDNYVYRFDFRTDWNIDANHNMILKDGSIPVPLDGDVDIFIILRNFRPISYTPTEMDSIIDIYSLANYDGNAPQTALVQERLNVRFGRYMENLWNRSRTTIDEGDYKLHEVDIPARYESDVFQRDANGVIEFEFVDGKRVPIYLHRAGDIVMLEDGSIKYKHRKGTMVIENGKPVLKEGDRGLRRQFDVVVMDGLYYLTTHEETINYVSSILDTIDEVVFDILARDIDPELIQRTSILYHPKSTVGPIKLLADNGLEIIAKSDQSLHITFRVSPQVYTNIDLRKNIEYRSKILVQEIFEKHKTISLDSLINAVRDELIENILGVTIEGFMEDKHTTVTVVDDLTTPSIGKNLYVNSKLELVVQDSVTFEFIQHKVTNLLRE